MSGKKIPVDQRSDAVDTADDTAESTRVAETMDRMNAALKRALDTPPRLHKDEPKRSKSSKATQRR